MSEKGETNSVIKIQPNIKIPEIEISYALFEDENDLLNDDMIENALFGKVPLELTVPDKRKQNQYQLQIVWFNVVAMGAVHMLALVGALTMPYVHSATFYYTIVLLLFSSLGVQAGAHRLWSHRAYKANYGLRLFLSLCHVMALQNDLYEWARDHRAHHKFSETDADPHNSRRGFFFSHVGWLLVKKHPDVIRRGKNVDLSDIQADPVVMFQRKYYFPLVVLLWAFVPVFIPVYFWRERLWHAVTVCVFFRYTALLNSTWLVNSWSHMFGYRPYDAQISPVESSIRHIGLGEGFHNYHHSFPWDYSASELGAWDVFNPATAAIDFFHWAGWAWDLKKPTPAMVDNKIESRGDRNQHVYKKQTTVYEWTAGWASFLAPFFVLRLMCFW